jgi:PAS domain S-box-containing protein
MALHFRFMNEAVLWIEGFLGAMPLPMLEVWGRLAYILGWVLLVCAFGRLTFRVEGRWSLGWERQTWDAQAFFSIPLTFFLIIGAGYLGSFVVLVPGAQTFESLKDLVVFLCVVLFGYPALITVPFAYGVADLIEGVQPASMLNWLPGYFINPAVHWVAYQMIGRNPDFSRLRTWGPYLVFAVIFMALYPFMWGYICSETFTREISYGSITPSLFFTAGVTLLIAPIAMLGALPLTRRVGLFWAEIPGHVRERRLGRKEWRWRSAGDAARAAGGGVPLRIVIFAPFIVLVLVMVAVTAYVALRGGAADSDRIVRRLQQAIAVNINILLNRVPVGEGAEAGAEALAAALRAMPVATYGRVFVLDKSGMVIASSAGADDAVVAAAIKQLGSSKEAPEEGQFHFVMVDSKPLKRETWLGNATVYRNERGERGDWLVVSAMPETFYREGLQAGNSRSAMIFAIALLVSLVVAAVLAAKVAAPIRRISRATRAMAEGDLSQQLPGSRIEEMDVLSRSFSEMAARLKQTFDEISGEMEMRRSVQARLREELDFSDAVLNSLPGVFYYYDESLQFLRWNRNLELITGYSSDELRALNPLMLIAERERKLVESTIREVFEQGESHVKSDLLLKDGRTIPYFFTGVNFEKGEKKNLVGVGVDISELKQMEEDLREKTALFAAQVESSLDGILVVNERGERVIHNRRMNELWKIPPEIADSLDDAVQIEFVTQHTKNPEEFVARVEWLYSHPLEISRDEVELVDGTVLDRYSAPVLGTDGRHYGRTWIFRDITEKRRREKMLAEALEHEKALTEEARAGARAKSEFLAVMSHEVRTPLNGILGFAALLRMSPGLPPESLEHARIITQSGEALLRILDDILDFSRLEAGRLKVESADFEPVALLEDIRALLSKQAEEYGLSLAVSCAKDIPARVRGDAGRLRQVLLNLVGNALKFTESGGVRIELSRVAEIPGMYVFSVTDTGCGIDESQMERIFEPFTQADSSNSRRYCGTGLGLTISRRLVELMDGTISVRSTPGKGSEFRVVVPLEATTAATALALSGDGEGEELDAGFAARHPLRLLIVEDDCVNLKLITALVRRLGYVPLTSSNGCEAVKIFKKESPDFILMDLQMPEMDGIEATEKIRALERANGARPPVVIVALTANIFPADRERCFDAGMDNYLNKPVRIAALADVFARANEFKSRR